MEVRNALGEGRMSPSLGGKRFMNLADRNFEDHRNRFIRLGLYSGMRLFLAFSVVGDGTGDEPERLQRPARASPFGLTELEEGE
jgi:hypothetical protein